MTGNELIEIMARLNAERRHEDVNTYSTILRVYGWTTDEFAEEITKAVEKRAFDTDAAIALVRSELQERLMEGRCESLSNLASEIVHTLKREMLFAARISAGYHPSRLCRRCGGPLEEIAETDERMEGFCDKCWLKLKIENQLDKLEEYSEKIRVLEGQIAHRNLFR